MRKYHYLDFHKFAGFRLQENPWRGANRNGTQGHVITLDAWHTVHDKARLIVETHDAE